MSEIARYGVKEATVVRDDIDVLVEEVRLLGYSTLRAGLSDTRLDALSTAFDAAAARYKERAAASGYDLAALKESDVIRVLPAIAPEFLDLVFSAPLRELVSRLLGEYYILNQANGLINRAKAAYSQSAFHRDLPYQHFVCSRPIAINALFALDDFTLENGATHVIPASHRQEAFPADDTVRRVQKQVTVARGTFIVLDCMIYHAGGANASTADRRAINHVFTIPMLRQQLHLPSILGDSGGLSDAQKRMLGYGLDEYRSLDAWFDARAAKP